MFKVGLRVVRGKDWKWGNQDSGKGHVGTVIRLNDDPQTVTVCWDNEAICDYRVGHENAYDLRVFDNGPVGVRHPGVQCDGCFESVIGFRFKCLHCPDFDFCTHCYMNESSHDRAHAFCRFDSDEDREVQALPLRVQSERLNARGIFKDAIVTRGKDWKYGNQYGGKTCKGTVLKICSDNNFDRGAAQVKFSHGKTSIFALGLKGKVELKFVQSSSNGYYYPDHLPLLVKPLPVESLQEVMEQHNQRENMEVFSVMYDEKIEQVLANLRYIPDEELQGHHEAAVQECLQALSQVRPLTENQISTVKEHIKQIYQEYKGIDAGKETSNAPAIGIDIGTNCCVAVYRNERVEIIPNLFRENTTPSYVAFNNDNEILVGKIAKYMAHCNPQNTVYDVKRMCGRHFNDPNIQKMIKYWPFDIDEGEEGKIQIKVQNQSLLPEEVLAHLLTYLKTIADEYLGDPVINAVVTVPAYFDARQRSLTKDACNKAGLNVLQFVSEPAAAAIAYGLHHKNENGKRSCLIFDLGGGTFDVAVLELHENHIQIKAIDGDPFLGGEDFDNAMIEYCVKAFEREHGIDLMKVGSKFERDKRLKRIKTECEEQKRYLSAITKVKISMDKIHGEIPLEVPLTRNIFSDLIKPLVDKCMKVVDQVLAKCQVKETDIKDIVVVGGSTRVPYVQSRLSEKFGGRPLLKRIRPEEVVAHGAAIVAYHFETPEIPNVSVRMK